MFFKIHEKIISEKELVVHIVTEGFINQQEISDRKMYMVVHMYTIWLLRVKYSQVTNIVTDGKTQRGLILWYKAPMHNGVELFLKEHSLGFFLCFSHRNIFFKFRFDVTSTLLLET